MHELLSVCVSSFGEPPVHPQFGREDAPGCGAHAALPAQYRRQPAAAEVAVGWHGKEQEDGPGHVISVQHTERHQMQKSILIMAIQGRSKIAFLILESSDRKHPPC